MGIYASMALTDSPVVFVAGLLVGAAAIHVGRLLVGGHDDFGRAVVTAFAGAVAWVLVALFFGWVPLLGPALALAASVSVINLRYPGDRVSAAGTAPVARAASLVVLSVLSVFGLTQFTAIGVPGV